MAHFACTMFGHILYDDSLTYQELLETEARVMAVMRAALEECGAHHIDFAAQADSLLMECVFAQVDREINRTLCDAVIRHFGSSVLARFTFVDRAMDSVVFYFLGRGKWKEQALSVPTPKEALAGWVVRQERRPSPDRVADRIADNPDDPDGPDGPDGPDDPDDMASRPVRMDLGDLHDLDANGPGADSARA